MSENRKAIELDIPRTAAGRLAKEAESIHGLIKRMEAKASDGRYYAFEDVDREKAIALLKRHAASYGRVLADLADIPGDNSLTDPSDMGFPE